MMLALSSWTTARALGFADVAVQTMLEAQASGGMVTGLVDASETRFESDVARAVLHDPGSLPDLTVPRP